MSGLMMVTIAGTVAFVLEVVICCLWAARHWDARDRQRDAHVDPAERSLEMRIERVADELVEVRIAVARLEHSRRH